MPRFLDRVRFNVSAPPGTGGVTVGSAVTAFQTPAQAGANDGETFAYLIEDGANWEKGVGTYTAGVLARTRIDETSAGNTTPLNVSSNAIVSFILGSSELKQLATDDRWFFRHLGV